MLNLTYAKMQWLKTFSLFILFLRTSRGGSFHSKVESGLSFLDSMVRSLCMTVILIIALNTFGFTRKNIWAQPDDTPMPDTKHWRQNRQKVLFFSCRQGINQMHFVCHGCLQQHGVSQRMSFACHFKNKKQNTVYAAQFAIQCDTRDICKKWKTFQSQTLQIYLALISATYC